MALPRPILVAELFMQHLASDALAGGATRLRSLVDRGTRHGRFDAGDGVAHLAGSTAVAASSINPHSSSRSSRV